MSARLLWSTLDQPTRHRLILQRQLGLRTRASPFILPVINRRSHFKSHIIKEKQPCPRTRIASARSTMTFDNTFLGGGAVMTPGIAALGSNAVQRLLQTIAVFD